jgi:hypothetical protein
VVVVDTINDNLLAFGLLSTITLPNPINNIQIKEKNVKYSILFILALTVCGCDIATQKTPDGVSTTPSSSNVPDRDNSAVNQRDRSDVAKTPFDQNENQADIDITANIRKQVVDSEMSVNAQNVKIITQNGHVTLRGPVATADEKTQIETIARKVAGDTNVESQIEVEQSK